MQSIEKSIELAVPIDRVWKASTLVKFKLDKTAKGTLLTITETGFDKIPAYRRAEALRMNDGGWTEQVKNIERYVAAHPR